MAQRNLAIVRRYLAGESISTIAADHDMSRQRVQQIYARANAHRPPLRQTRGRNPNSPTALKRHAYRVRGAAKREHRRLWREAVDAMREAKLPWREIAAYLEMKVHTLQRDHYARHKVGAPVSRAVRSAAFAERNREATFLRGEGFAWSVVAEVLGVNAKVLQLGFYRWRKNGGV
jgi:hypothetical protein